MTVLKVPYVDLGAQWRDIREVVLARIDEVLSSGMYLEHPLIQTLESQLAHVLGVNDCVSVNSGTDALLLTLVALGVKPGDEIITVPNSFIASVAAIEHVGAKTQFVDVGADHLMDIDQVESAITSRTVGVMAVHLEGKMCDMSRLAGICSRKGIFLIEDAAQAIGSLSAGLSPGQLSDAACFSLHPLKNLNACGDGGFVATNRHDIATKIRTLRNHGQESRNSSENFGVVSRMDSLQAAVVIERLRHLDTVIRIRRANARRYFELMRHQSDIKLPVYDESVSHSFHLFVIEVEKRDLVQSRLKQSGVETRIHYPRLISQQPAFLKRYGDQTFRTPIAVRQVESILSLPIHQHLSEKQVEFVAQRLVEAID